MNWSVWTYDVWGNAKDGFEVNDRSCIERSFESKTDTPTTREIRSALRLDGWHGGIAIDRDDCNVYVSAKRSGRPIGELICEELRDESEVAS